MPVEIKALSENLKANRGTVVSWEKQEGEKVVKDEVIVLVETEKVIIEITSPSDGILAKILVQVTQEFDMKQPLGFIIGEGEELDLSSIRVSDVEAEHMHMEPEEAVVAKDGPIMVMGNGFLAQFAVEQAANNGYQVMFSTHKNDFVPGYFDTLVFLKKVLKELHCFKVSKIMNVKGRVSDSQSWDALRHLYQKHLEFQKAEYARLESTSSFEYIGSEVTFQSETEALVKTDKSGSREITFANAILVFDPKPESVSEEISHRVFNVETIWDQKKRPQNVLISGATPVGIGLAALFYVLGSKVTIVDEASGLDIPNDQELVDELVKHMENCGIELRFLTRLESVKATKAKVSAILSSAGSESSWDGDAVLLSGFNTNSLFPGIDSVDSHLKMPKGDVYKVGLPVKRATTVQMAMHEIQVVLSNIAGRKTEVDYSSVPLIIDFSPSLASIGLTEEQAGRVCPGYSVIRGDNINLFSTDGKSIGGLAKILIDPDSGEILGAHLFMDHSEELIGEISLALRAEATIEEIADCNKPYMSYTGHLTELARGR